MLVKATNKYKELGIQDRILNKVPSEGEEFEVSSERFEVLNGNNEFKAIFVEEVKVEEENNKIETATVEVKTEKAIKKTRSKKD